MANNTIDIRTFADWTLLMDEEIQTTLSRIDTKDLERERRKPSGGREKDHVKHLGARQGFVRKIWAESSISPEDIEASQKKILQIIHGLQNIGKIRSSSENQG